MHGLQTCLVGVQIVKKQKVNKISIMFLLVCCFFKNNAFYFAGAYSRINLLSKGGLTLKKGGNHV